MHPVYRFSPQTLPLDISFDYYGRRLALCTTDLRLNILSLSPPSLISPSSLTPSSHPPPSPSPPPHSSLPLPSSHFHPHSSTKLPSPSLSPSTYPPPSSYTHPSFLQYSFLAHENGPYKVRWAHPDFGCILGTSSNDKTIIIWEEPKTNILWEEEGKGRGGREEEGMKEEEEEEEEERASKKEEGSAKKTEGGSSRKREEGRRREEEGRRKEEGGITIDKPWLIRTKLSDSQFEVEDFEFGPRHKGLCLCAVGQDGFLRVYEAPNVLNLGAWRLTFKIMVNPNGLTSVSWSKGIFGSVLIAVGGREEGERREEGGGKKEEGGVRRERGKREEGWREEGGGRKEGGGKKEDPRLNNRRKLTEDDGWWRDGTGLVHVGRREEGEGVGGGGGGGGVVGGEIGGGGGGGGKEEAWRREDAGSTLKIYREREGGGWMLAKDVSFPQYNDPRNDYGHKRTVFDVAWASGLGRTNEFLASCGRDGLFIWSIYNEGGDVKVVGVEKLEEGEEEGGGGRKEEEGGRRDEGGWRKEDGRREEGGGKREEGGGKGQGGRKEEGVRREEGGKKMAMKLSWDVMGNVLGVSDDTKVRVWSWEEEYWRLVSDISRFFI